MTAPVYVGTSGYSYDDWVGPFYPEGLPREGWLPFYADRFRAVELNYTYYRIPQAGVQARLLRRVPEDFLFTAKAPGEVTHRQSRDPAVYRAYVEGMAPLLEAGRLKAVLLQFPYRFHRTPEAEAFLAFVAGQWGETFPLVAEFRHWSWDRPDVLPLLRRLGIGYCAVDLPPLRGLPKPRAWVTAPVAYVRFHGRNRERWWEHEHAWQRYDYRYRRGELVPWVGRIRAMAERAQILFAFANNHWQAQGVETASLLKELLREAGLEVR